MAGRMLRPRFIKQATFTLSLDNIWLHNCNGSKKSAVTEWGSRGGDETAEASDAEGHFGGLGEHAGCSVQSTWSRPEKGDAEADRTLKRGEHCKEAAKDVTTDPHRLPHHRPTAYSYTPRPLPLRPVT